MGQGQKIYEMFKESLDSKDFHYEPHDDDLAITLTVHGNDLPQPTVIRVMDDRDTIFIYSPIPSKMPEDKRMEAAVAVAVANNGMLNGCFDLDMSDGEIRFRVTESYRGCEVSMELLEFLLQLVFIMTDKYNDRFFMLSKGMMSLEQFIEKENE